MGFAVGGGDGGGSDGHGSALSLLGELDELGEHVLAGGASELVDVGGGEVLSGDGVKNYTVLAKS